ncbi:hypothetical protein EVAR_31865_1 [Eumeta japonica]|uniref:Odorant receptor n=1 Tax=Eumeta variegata TaxID=151549 RepID=A0A4C1WZ66_EUMVA|nr:hypothetical protein EVAR_31865_1 [Eumeta japonica]
MSTVKSIRYIKNMLKSNTVESLMWVVHLSDVLSGLGLFTRKGLVSAFAKRVVEVGHLLLLSHMYIFGVYAYVHHYESDLLTKIQSIVYIVGFLTYSNALLWIIFTRSDVEEIKKLIKISDSLAQETVVSSDRHKSLMSSVKWFILTFYTVIFIQSMIYIPTHTSTRALTDPTLYRMVPCVGIGQVDKYPNKGVCKTIIALQVWMLVTVLIYFTNMFLLLIGHLAAMYELLVEEMTDIPQQLQIYPDDVPESSTAAVETRTVLDQELVRRHLEKVVSRHTLLLMTIDKVKNLYSSRTGVDFGLNLIVIFVVIILPLHDILKLSAYIGYSVLHLLLYCIACQRLENASQKFERAVYCCGWEEFDVPNRKSIFVMLVQAQKPLAAAIGRPEKKSAVRKAPQTQALCSMNADSSSKCAWDQRRGHGRRYGPGARQLQAVAMDR